VEESEEIQVRDIRYNLETLDWHCLVSPTFFGCEAVAMRGALIISNGLLSSDQSFSIWGRNCPWKTEMWKSGQWRGSSTRPFGFNFVISSRIPVKYL
jgi:hypothetical protein